MREPTCQRPSQSLQKTHSSCGRSSDWVVSRHTSVTQQLLHRTLVLVLQTFGMQSDKRGRPLALGVIAVAACSTLASISLPVRSRKPDAMTIVLVLVLLLAHAAVYWFGSSIRTRFGVARYVALQAVLIFAIAFADEI